jgi:hypothetical protein
MLTKHDIKLIGDVVDVKIKAAFADFYDNLFEPMVNKNEKDHVQILEEIKKINLRADKQDGVLRHIREDIQVIDIDRVSG